MSDSLFDVPGDPGAGDSGAPALASAPLAVRMRPAGLDEVVGQSHLLQAGSPLRRLVEGSGAASVILYGPPGTGKTTLASLISQATGRRFEALSALTAGVKEVRAVIDIARRAAVHGEQTVLFIDEVHRFSKTQQDALLAAVENRVVLLVAATTENPSFSVVAPLLSRSLILQLQPLSAEGIGAVVRRALADPRGLDGAVKATEEAVELLVRLSSGDARRALTALEVAAETAGGPGGVISVEIIEQSLDKAAVRYDRDGDQHYDVVSAFIKSVRGSDVDAALHYLARMLVAGEDPRFVARRLMILASEDIGMADPTALQTAVAAAQTVQLIGMPEAQLTLAHATVHLATAPKSNAVTTALGAAMNDIRGGKAGLVPPHLRDGHYSGAQKLGNAVGYKYAHDHPDGVVPQQYPPDDLVGVDYYKPTGRGFERELATRVDKLRAIIRRARR
ncbi:MULTISPECIES: replication-associated recombination protein A [unclassified Mycolicibacterium]|uniref:replication-associated recombination protein A n=1 Tax=unclassified Mycolicibacterium TaxID=2636767 RepID=UPI00130A440C|nr:MULTISPECIES: replication-associated recombination protein A [unclassified Mycolicibacterium]MUL84408.1 replication-associated recombination protein A [Mycolicibacterium sp. CBMA 329]MUL88183.1 replication-associated recombination protein A [Mycolicibacterium sp. CBMA 331]MUL99368.1 replication-associated recombination protein A [Mycolicibacterium sp. CBMA 334]MUM39830.1 replication-associated recombination protein A [Mycolicibacterium sp. CBMA 247]MUM44248.1 replication-associated recombin